jgi:serine/threonine protein kinase
MGSFGTVHLGWDTITNTFVAIKECSKTKLKRQKQESCFGGRGRGRGTRRVTISRPKLDQIDPLALVRGEVAILKKLHHPNIVKLYEVLDDPRQDSLFMVFELCEKGSVLEIQMDTHVTPLAVEKVHCIFQQLILGIEYCIYCLIST